MSWNWIVLPWLALSMLATVKLIVTWPQQAQRHREWYESMWPDHDYRWSLILNALIPIVFAPICIARNLYVLRTKGTLD